MTLAPSSDLVEYYSIVLELQTSSALCCHSYIYIQFVLHVKFLSQMKQATKIFTGFKFKDIAFHRLFSNCLNCYKPIIATIAAKSVISAIVILSLIVDQIGSKETILQRSKGLWKKQNYFIKLQLQMTSIDNLPTNSLENGACLERFKTDSQPCSIRANSIQHSLKHDNRC